MKFVWDAVFFITIFTIKLQKQLLSGKIIFVFVVTKVQLPKFKFCFNYCQIIAIMQDFDMKCWWLKQRMANKTKEGYFCFAFISHLFVFSATAIIQTFPWNSIFSFSFSRWLFRLLFQEKVFRFFSFPSFVPFKTHSSSRHQDKGKKRHMFCVCVCACVFERKCERERERERERV